MTTVTRVQLSTWTNKCRGNSIGFLLRNMDAISLSLGGIHTGPKLHSVLRGQITTQPKVMKLLSWHIQCSLNSEWAAGGSLVQHEKPPLQLHQVGAGNPPRDALGRLWHPRTRGKPAERHPDGYLHDAEDFWTVSSNHKCWYTIYCSDNKSWCPMGSQTWLQILGATLGFSSVSPVLLFLTISASWQPNCLWLWIISNRTIFVESLIMTTKFLIYANLLYMIWN